MNEQIVVPIVIAVVVPLVLRWLASGSAAPGQPGLLCYSRRARLFAVGITLVPCLLFGGLALAVDASKPGEVISVVMLVVLFLALGVPLILEFFRLSIRYDDKGIHVASPWSRRRTLRWDLIQTVRWRPVAKWLDLSDGENVVHISPFLTGLPGFAAACRTSLPEGVFARDYEASVVLLLMAQGHGRQLAWAQGLPSQILAGGNRR